MAGINNTLFDTVKVENGLKIIDIDQNLEKYALLSELFHSETIAVRRDESVLAFRTENKRYFGDSTMCYNCGQTGHVSKMCDMAGNWSCPFCDISHSMKPCDYIFCDNCRNLGHKESRCRERKSPRFLCRSCPGMVHHSCDCPRHWRQYKLKHLKINSKLKMSCPYCHSRSHLIDDCKMKNRQISIFTKAYRNIVGKKPKQ